MSTARQVTDPYFLSTVTATADPGRASIGRAGLIPETSPAWWWGVAPGGLSSAGNTAAAPAPLPTPDPGSPPASSDCGCR